MTQNNTSLDEHNADEQRVKQKEKRHFSFRSLIYNNKVAMLFSLLAAFCLWIWVAVEKSPVIETTIHAVPVQIDIENSVPSQLNLQMFGKKEYYVDVVVTGKRFIVSTLKPEDISVVAQTNYVDSSGNKSLQLRAAANNSKDFEISRLSQNFVDVYFDTYKEVEFPIEPRIIAPKNKTVIDGCILGNIVFSQKSIVVSGASTDVNKIIGVVAETTLEQPLSVTTTAKANIKLQTDGDETLSYVSADTGEGAITMTMPVLKKVVLPTTVTFQNIPTGYLNTTIPVKVYPAKAEAAIPIEKLEETTSISVGTIDFSDLKSGKNNFTFTSSDIVDYSVSDTHMRFKVTVDMSSTETVSSFSVPTQNIKITAQKSGYHSSVLTNGLNNVKIVGTKAEIAALTNEMLFVDLDLTGEELKEGTQTVMAHVIIQGNTKAWVTDSYPVEIKTVKTE